MKKNYNKVSRVVRTGVNRRANVKGGSSKALRDPEAKKKQIKGKHVIREPEDREEADSDEGSYESDDLRDADSGEDMDEPVFGEDYDDDDDDDFDVGGEDEDDDSDDEGGEYDEKLKVLMTLLGGKGNGEKRKRGSTSKNKGGDIDRKKKVKHVKVKREKSYGQRVQVKREKSYGQRVKEKGVVVETQNLVSRKAPNLHGVRAFVNLVKVFDDSRKKVVQEMGFGGLLELGITYIPWKFVYWLLTKVENGSMIFGDGYVFPLSPVQVHCILGVSMGSKPVPAKVPKGDDVLKAEVRRICDMFVDKGDSIPISVAGNLLMRYDRQKVVLPLTEDEIPRFKIAFLVVALGYLLCATTNSTNIGSALNVALTVADVAQDYDWCTFIFNWMSGAAKRFQKKFTEKGYVVGSGGCILYLLVFYLDHLSRTPVEWGVTPRIKVWSQEEVVEAIRADKFESGDYGMLSFVNVAYGEHHPLMVRDSIKTRHELIVEEVIGKVTPLLMTTIDEKVSSLSVAGGEHSEGVVADSLAESLADSLKKELCQRVDEEVVRNVTPLLKTVIDHKVGSVYEGMKDLLSQSVACATTAGKPCPEKILSVTASGGTLFRRFVNEAEGGLGMSEDAYKENERNPVVDAVDKSIGVVIGEVNDEYAEGGIDGEKSIDSEDDEGDDVFGGFNKENVLGVSSVGSMGTPVMVAPNLNNEEGYSSSDEGEEVKVDGSTGGSAAKRVVKPTCEEALSEVFSKASHARRHNTLECRLLQFIRAWKDLKDPNCPGTILIRCDNITTDQRDCYGVVHPMAMVGDNYVRVASVLYTKFWAESEFVGRRKRLLLDPSFALLVMLKEKRDKNVAKTYGKAFLNLKLSEIRSVFIPVLIVPPGCLGDEHWWCHALDLKGKTLWIIDSLYKDPFKKHAAIIALLFDAIDELFKLSDPQWSGGLGEWKQAVIEVVGPSDAAYCGALMLSCIKYCARRFTTKFGMGKIGTARSNLFLDDVQCEFNELKDDLESLTPTRKTERRHA